jgi:hypothetical protein
MPGKAPPGGQHADGPVITEGRAAIALEVAERLQVYLNRYGTGILVAANIDKACRQSRCRTR